MSKRQRWEIRRALRYGSEPVGWSRTLRNARLRALKDIRKHGDVGRIGFVSRATKTLYYDVYEETT